MSKSTSSEPGRRGVILIGVLVALLVVLMVSVGMTDAFVVHSRRMHEMEYQQQAFWLAESGLQRAVRNLTQTPDYRGEVWNAFPESHSSQGQVRIEVIVDDSNENRRIIRTNAVYPSEGSRHARQSRELNIELSRPGGTS